MFRSVDTELLEDICRDIALQNYGFLYVNDHKDEIKSRYEQSDTDLLDKGSVSQSDLKSALNSIIEDDFSDFEQLRTGVYFVDPLEKRRGSEVIDQLKDIFEYNLVVNKQTIESKFDIAPTDVDFLTSRFETVDLVRRITAGEREYFTSGPRLKDETGGATSVDSRLNEAATHGRIAHADLEDVIDVAATRPIITYLSREEFIADLDGEYLVKSAMDEFAAHVGREVHESVGEAFGDVGILPKAEFEQVVENAVTSQFDVLTHLSRSDESELMSGIVETVKTEAGLSEDGDVVLQDETFEEFVDHRARTVLDEVDDQALGKPSEIKEAGEPELAEIAASESEVANEYVRDAVRDRFEQQVDEMFETASEEE